MTDTDTQSNYRPLFKLAMTGYAIGVATTFAFLAITEREQRHRIVDVFDYLAASATPLPSLSTPQPPTERRPQSTTLPTAATGVLPPDPHPNSGLVIDPLNVDDDPFFEIERNGTMLPDLEAAASASASTSTDVDILSKLDMLFTAKEIDALIEIECGGNHQLIGDGGRAYGPLQIWQVYADDVNETFGTNIKAPSLVGDRKTSVLVANAYMHRYGKGLSFEERARIHNKGPSAKIKGHQQRQKSNPYWKKVETYLAAQ